MHLSHRKIVSTPLVREVPRVIKLARAPTMRTIGEDLWMTGTAGHGKSQVNRTRIKLGTILGVEDADAFSPEYATGT